MNYTKELLKNEAKFSFKVENAEWDKDIESAYQKTKNKYKLEGFRQGKVPRRMIERIYGEGVFFDDAFNICAQRCYIQALSENPDLIPVDDPHVDISSYGSDGSDLEFSMSVVLRPKVKLGAFKGLTLNKVEYPTTDLDVENEIDKARERGSRTVKLTDEGYELKDGDIANIDYSGSVDGVKFDGGTAQGHDLTIGSNSFIPGFEAQLIGMKVGDVRDINVKFPDEYHAENLKGKDSVFNVKVNSISKKELPELNDEFVKDISKFGTVEEYRADVKNRLTEANNKKAEEENKNNVIEKICEGTTIDIPECMINEELEYMLEDFAQQLKYMYGGMELDKYFELTKTTKDDFKKDRRPSAERSVKVRLVLQQIIKDENIEVTDEDFDNRLEKIALNANSTVEKYRSSLNEQRIRQIKNDLLIEKLLSNLVSWNTFVVGEKEEKPKKTTPKTTTSNKAASPNGTATKKPTAKKSTTKATE